MTGSDLRRRLVQPWVVMPAVAILAVGSWLVVRYSESSSGATGASTQLVAATTGPMQQTITASGTIAAAQTANLNFTSAGTVTAVNVSAGDQVKSGQVLATVNSAQLQAAVSTAQSTLSSAQAQLSDDEAAGASSAQIQADTTRVASAQATLDSANQALAGASLVATFDGTVSAVNVTVGEQLSSSGTGGTSTSGSGSGSGQSNNSLGNGSRGGTGSSSSSSSSSTGEIQVISTGQFTVQLGISDLDVKNLAAGQAATITLSSATNSGNGRGFGGFGGGGGFAQRLANGGGGGGGGTGASGASGTSGASAALAAVAPASGTVTSVGRVATASSGVASYPVVVSFSTTTGEFNPGATASVSIVYNQIADAIQVPTRAVTFSGGQSTVTVSNNGKRSTRTVTTGITSGGMIQITSGLSDGEEVVVSTPTVTGGGNGTGSGGRLNGASGFPGGAGGAGGATNGKPVIVDGGGG